MWALGSHPDYDAEGWGFRADMVHVLGNCDTRTLPISKPPFHAPSNPYTRITSRFSKRMRWKLTTPTTYHKTKWESVGLMDGYYFVGVTTILYTWFGVIIHIVSREDNSYRVTISNMPQCIYPDFTKMSYGALQKKRKWVYCKHLYYVFQSQWKVDYENNKFIHAPTYT